MITSNINNKSKKLAARVPHELVADLNEVKSENETTSQFIVLAIKEEIKRRKRKIAKR